MAVADFRDIKICEGGGLLRCRRIECDLVALRPFPIFRLFNCKEAYMKRWANLRPLKLRPPRRSAPRSTLCPQWYLRYVLARCRNAKCCALTYGITSLLCMIAKKLVVRSCPLLSLEGTLRWQNYTLLPCMHVDSSHPTKTPCLSMFRKKWPRLAGLNKRPEMSSWRQTRDVLAQNIALPRLVKGRQLWNLP